MTLQQVNSANNRFWQEQNLLNQRRMSKRMVLRRTITLVESENSRLLIRARGSWESICAAADSEIHDEMASRGKHGGKVSKADPLTLLVREIVRARLNISQHELLRELKNQAGNGLIVRTGIFSQLQYLKEDGVAVNISISAIKHRLYRARKKIESR